MYQVSSTFMGGLGNRLFQLAVSYGYAKKYNKECVININKYQNNPHSSIDYLNTIFSKVKKVTFQPNYHINEPGHKNISYFNLSNHSGNVMLFGYFQCEKYFKEYRKDIKELLVLDSFSNVPKANSIFLHVRRGDYTHIHLHGGYNYDLYYKNALDYMKKKYEKLNVYVFSNDMEWCKSWNLLSQYENYEFYFLDLNELETLKFMTLCDKGGIGANSSFSWWGGYLNDFPDKTIIFPNRWFFDEPYTKYENDVAFEGSIRLDCI
jgi:hypothetical protein